MSLISRAETEASTLDSEASSVKRRRRRRQRFSPFLVVVGLILLWHVITTVFRVPVYIVPGPIDVLSAFRTEWEILLRNTWPTAFESVVGFLLGNVIAIALATLFVHVKSVERALFPVAVFVRTVPIVAIAPVLVIIFGTGYTPKILIAALISFFPTLVNVVRGLEAVDRQKLELLRVLSASKREVFFNVRVYAAMPFLFASLKIAATASVIGALVAEWIGSERGLGYLIISTTYNFDVPLLYATMIMGSLLATAFFGLMQLIEKWVVTWDVDDTV